MGGGRALSMKIVFFGTPDYVVPILEAVNKHFKTKFESPIVAVVTKKPYTDKEGKEVFSEVDHWAHKRNIPKFYSAQEWLDSGIKADLGILASYGAIIPDLAIKGLKLGILNLHPSLLPKYRGSSPIPATLAMGDTQTGVSIIKLDEKLDHGPVMTFFKEEILPHDTYENLRARLFNRGAEALVEMLPAFTSGKIKPKPQNHEEAIFTRELKREDGFLPIDLILPTLQGASFKGRYSIPFIKSQNEVIPDANFIERYLRALTPWPGIYTQFDGKRLKILKVHTNVIPAKAGIHTNTGSPIRSGMTQNMRLVIDTVQLEGKNEVTFKQFVEGYPGSPFSALLHHE